MTQPVLTLFSREGCHLCELVREEVEPWRERLGFDLEVVDVDRDPALQQRYGLLVPVLADGEQEICRYFFDPDALSRHLHTHYPR